MVKNIIIIISLLIAAVLGYFNISLQNQLKSQTLVKEVVDGDTFQLNSGKRVRLMGIDAPEYDRCGGQEAKKRLEELILNKPVEIKEEADEAYGRTLGLVYLNSLLVNKIMLEEGWGRTDYRKNSQRETLTAAFHQAQKNKVGIWSNLCRETETKSTTDCLIKGNIDKATYQKFYHLPHCKHYQEVVIEKDLGERYFCTEKEAIEAGFKKAGGC